MINVLVIGSKKDDELKKNEAFARKWFHVSWEIFGGGLLLGAAGVLVGAPFTAAAIFCYILCAVLAIAISVYGIIVKAGTVSQYLSSAVIFAAVFIGYGVMYVLGVR